MKDKNGKTLCARYKGETYNIGNYGAFNARVRIAIPVSDGSQQAYSVKWVRVDEVEFLIK